MPWSQADPANHMGCSVWTHSIWRLQCIDDTVPGLAVCRYTMCVSHRPYPIVARSQQDSQHSQITVTAGR